MSETARGFVLIAGAAILAAAMLAVWLLGADRLFILALILAGGLAMAGIIAASALPIRAARKRDMTGETRIMDGTRTVIKERVIDGRAPAQNDIRLLQLPQQPTGGAWPELLRASYQAGLLGNPAERSAPARDLEELDLTGGDGWGGDIAP